MSEGRRWRSTVRGPRAGFRSRDEGWQGLDAHLHSCRCGLSSAALAITQLPRLPSLRSAALEIMAAEAEEQPKETPQEEVAEEKAEETPEEETPKEESPEEESPAEEEEEAPAEEEEEEEEEEEVVDPKAEIENGCKPKCVKQLLAYQACESRIEEDEDGQKHCTGQYFDYWGCIDKCAAPKLFRKLK